jgi:hypothetical protein
VRLRAGETGCAGKDAHPSASSRNVGAGAGAGSSSVKLGVDRELVYNDELDAAEWKASGPWRNAELVPCCPVSSILSGPGVLVVARHVFMKRPVVIRRSHK